MLNWLKKLIGPYEQPERQVRARCNMSRGPTTGLSDEELDKVIKRLEWTGLKPNVDFYLSNEDGWNWIDVTRLHPQRIPGNRSPIEEWRAMYRREVLHQYDLEIIKVSGDRGVVMRKGNEY